MTKRLTILCVSALLLAGILGCEAKTRYRALCLLFDGVPTPPGMAPCDGSKLAGAGAVPVASNSNEVARAYTQHGPYAAKLCEGCHQRQSNKLLMAKEDLCMNCHELSIKKRIIHGPVASGGCTICHDPHGSGNKYLLVAKSQEFCLYCHKREDILKDDVHQGVDATGCTSCHDAHASDSDYLLRESAGFEAQQKRHQASPQIKPEQKPSKQKFAKIAKAAKNSTITNDPEQEKREQ